MLETLFQSPNEIAFDLRPAEVRGDVENYQNIQDRTSLSKELFFFSAKDDFFLVLTRGDLF